jgi:hypothetical protein
MGKLYERLPNLSFAASIGGFGGNKHQNLGITKDDLRDAMMEAIRSMSNTKFVFDEEGFSVYIQKGNRIEKRKNVEYGI